MTEFTEEFFTIATQASSAFEELREQIEDAARGQKTPENGNLIGGRYLVEKELGEGGFGTVFVVRHKMLGHRFAMKVLNPRIAQDPDWIARFREEARATSLIGHESIVYVTDFGEDPQWGCYFVMEYLRGRPLDQVIKDEAPIAPERVLRLVHAAAGAFGAVHDLGIVHCDLKPSNVFAVDRSGVETWKFLDFGTSTVVMNTVQTQALYGTPLYMAPEQSIGLDIDGRADQFALGCVVYEMLTGKPPWDVRTWIQATPEIRANRLPKPPGELNESVPAGWDEPIMRALSIDPADRFAAIDEFARALDQSLEIDWQPTIDPMDVRQESVSSVAEEVEADEPDPGRIDAFRRTMTAPSVSIVQPDRPPSVVIDVDSGRETTGPPEVRISFRTRDRFVREYRRNLSVGGLFVPSDDLLALRSRVVLEIRFEPTGATCSVQATVVGHEPRRAAGRGFGVHVDGADRHLLEELMEQVRGGDIGPRDRLERIREPTEEDVLSPGEGFILSRVEPGMTLARLRAMCAGLPFDIDDVVRGLVGHGWIAVSEASEELAPPSAPSSPSSSSSSSSSSVPVLDDTPDTIELFAEEVDEVLERVDFHRSRANYLGATEVLERAIEASPEVAEFHYRLALLRLEFDGDYLAARTAARRAVKRAPENAMYVALFESLRNRD